MVYGLLVTSVERLYRATGDRNLVTAESGAISSPRQATHFHTTTNAVDVYKNGLNWNVSVSARMLHINVCAGSQEGLLL